MILKENFLTLLEKSNSNIINNKYSEYINNLSENLNNIPNLILHGPSGSGKYSEALKIIQKYSDSFLKYEKKMIINSSKNEHIIKISDIHYEINMENLTCNSKILLNDIYNNIIDAIQSSSKKNGIILCKNFHEINNEIIENFYSYMQKKLLDNIVIKFIILTEHLTFIPTNIQNVCKILYYSKLSTSNYIKLSNGNNKKFLLEIKKQKNDLHTSNINSINLLKYVDINEKSKKIDDLKVTICNKIVNIIFSKTFEYNKIRNILYDILIYNLNIYDCTYFIISSIILKKIELSNENIDDDFINDI